MRCWGYGADGELGNSSSGSSAYGPTPVTVCASAGCSSTFTGASAITGAGSTNCAIAGGAVYCWGDNKIGEVAVGSTTTPIYTVATRSLLTTGAISVTSESGANTVCARLNAGGTLRCWGYNPDGEVGNNSVVTPVTMPTAQSW